MDTCQHSPLHVVKTREEKCQAASTTHLQLLLYSVGKDRLMDNFSFLAFCKTDLIASQGPAPQD